MEEKVNISINVKNIIAKVLSGQTGEKLGPSLDLYVFIVTMETKSWD